MVGDLEPQRLPDGTVYYGQLGQIAYDPDEDKVQCHLCGEWFHCVGGPHLTHKHLDFRTFGVAWRWQCDGGLFG